MKTYLKNIKPIPQNNIINNIFTNSSFFFSYVIIEPPSNIYAISMGFINCFFKIHGKSEVENAYLNYILDRQFHLTKITYLL